MALRLTSRGLERIQALRGEFGPKEKVSSHRCRGLRRRSGALMGIAPVDDGTGDDDLTKTDPTQSVPEPISSPSIF